MKYSFTTLALVAMAALTACGGPDNSGSFLANLEDHEDPLTADAGDNLFTLEVFEAEQAYPVAGLMVMVNPYGGSASTVAFELMVDENGDNALGVGDVLVAREGSTDAYNASHSGTLFEVVITFLDDSGQVLDLAAMQWVGDGGLGAVFKTPFLNNNCNLSTCRAVRIARRR